MTRAKQELISHLILRAVTLPGFTGSTMAPVAAKELRLATFFGPRSPLDRFMLRPWKDEIARRSGGRLTIEIHPNLDPVAQYKFAADGEFDLSTSLPGYTSELFPRTGILKLPGVARRLPKKRWTNSGTCSRWSSRNGRVSSCWRCVPTTANSPFVGLTYFASGLRWNAAESSMGLP